MDMTMEKALEQVLNAYRRYYTISTENVTPPFQAEAVFSQHDERYFLSRKVKRAGKMPNAFVNASRILSSVQLSWSSSAASWSLRRSRPSKRADPQLLKF